MRKAASIAWRKEADRPIGTSSAQTRNITVADNAPFAGPKAFLAMPTAVEAELFRQVERALVLHDERAASAELAAALDRLAAWQTRRLNATYADLAAEPRYAQATAFFASDLYGPGDFRRRDADLARVVPLMAKVLPQGVIATISGAMELSALSRELDRALLAKLAPGAVLSVATYCRAYRALANRGARERQIELIVAVGRALDRYVDKPLIRSALAAMRQPARVAGLSALQDFLERGFAAFRNMGGADEFLATVESRETALMNAIFAGDKRPFPEP
jgi:hypothetical protein